jgi:hypothetical protein
MTGPSQPGRKCRFRLTDVLSPDRHQVSQQITADLEVSGEVMFFSDQGHEPDRFAIVAVEGIVSPLIVPADCLQPSWEGGMAADGGRTQVGRS